jgi:hypothetical protein
VGVGRGRCADVRKARDMHNDIDARYSRPPIRIRPDIADCDDIGNAIDMRFSADRAPHRHAVREKRAHQTTPDEAGASRH